MKLQDAWSRRGLAAWALTPLALVYALLAATHRALYRLGLLARQRLPVPVVVVGNVVAGGAGKTPVVAALVRHLQQAGWRPGILSRGYGRRDPRSGVLEVTAQSDPAESGDEPLLLARRCAVPVYVAARRAQAGTSLLRDHPEVDILVCDDGLQHHALARDLEICVFDERGVGNGWPLPAGPLREGWPRAVDFVLRPAALAQVAGFGVERRLAGEAVQADGTRRSLAEVAGSCSGPVIAVAGIARPQAFFDMLKAHGVLPAQAIALPDHHDFGLQPLALPPDAVCLCTEKDAVKLWHHLPQAWAVPLEVRIEPAFWQALDARLAQLPRLSSTDGSQTA